MGKATKRRSFTALVAYPVGIAFTVHTATRETNDLGLEAFGYGSMLAAGRPETDPAPELLRYGIEFPDGRRATSVGGFWQNSTGGSLIAVGEGPEPDASSDLILTQGGGTGGSRHSEQQCWAWPLPPLEGQVRFVCEWPLFDVAESSVQVEAAVVHDAAARAISVWD